MEMVAVTRYDARGPIIVWRDYGFDGWSPRSHDSLEEALSDVLHDDRQCVFVVTRSIDINNFKAVK